MSGKTTFIRALALCAVLAQALYTCPAGSYRAPFLRVRSYINRKDDLLGGRSYFLAEAEAVRDLLLASQDPGPQHLFAVDELFRGTNPAEGRAATRAVLEHLDAADHITLVATHDARLQALMGDAWDVYHFDSRVDAGRLVFDYRLRAGEAGLGNAIEVLAASGFPAAVVEAARRYVEDEKG